MRRMCALLVAMHLANPREAAAAPVTLTYGDKTPRWEYALSFGMPDGETSVYYPDGTVMVRGSYKEGLKHGVFYYYAPDGTLQERCLFAHGVREWRAPGSDLSQAPPLALLAKPRSQRTINANTGTLEIARLPFLPFAAVDRYSRRMGVVAGATSEDGTTNGLRGELFFHAVNGRFGLYVSASQTLILGSDFRGEDQSFVEEQGTLHAAATGKVLQFRRGYVIARAGYLRSFDSAPTDSNPVRGDTGGQRAADFVATFDRVKAMRASGSVVKHWRRFVGQLDAGLDSYSKYIDSETSSAGTLLRLNAAGAVYIGRFQFAVESANNINTEGPSLFTVGATANYLGSRLSWISANVMADQTSQLSMTVSFGSFLWRID